MASAQYGEHPDMYENRPCVYLVETRFAPLVSSIEQEALGTQTLNYSQKCQCVKIGSSHDGCVAMALVWRPHNTQGTPSKPGLRLSLADIDVTMQPALML